ncbi:MAG TPA: 3-isopropylmalate dehydratase small subunit [Verrucomicrobiae bacterium]|nr:3-isopropylmalate dehydratase small subunit [Verrucomicrobiae bacterium]
MHSFTEHEGLVGVLPRDDVDTDQIIPKQFLARTGRDGYQDGCFFAWRLDPTGQPRADFELNHPAFLGHSVLVAGRNFGCGSSREHAAWALLDSGVRVVVAPSFGDIFTVNALQNGLVPVTLEPAMVATLMARGQRRDGYRVTVDLVRQEVRDDEGLRAGFAVDPFWRACLLEGRDPIAMALDQEAAIAAHEAERSRLLPVTTGLDR